MICVRWRVILSPICWAFGHLPVVIESVPMGLEGIRCRACLAERRLGQVGFRRVHK